MNITSEQIKLLREKTGAGMLNCKNALLETQGDFEKAVNFLRQKGYLGVDPTLGEIERAQARYYHEMIDDQYQPTTRSRSRAKK